MEVCPNLELRFYFNGTGELVTHVAASQQNLSQPRDLYDFDTPEFSGIETQIEDVIAGNKLLIAVTDRILKTQDICYAESCDNPESGAWKNLEEYRKNLGHVNFLLHSTFPGVKASGTLQRERI